MKILIWNCCNGIADVGKADYLRSFDADLMIVPEIKKKDVALLRPTHQVWVTNNHSRTNVKGLGVFSFNDVSIQELPRDNDMEIFIPLRISTKVFSFNLLAVWNFYFNSKQGRFKGVKGDLGVELSALRHYRELMVDPCLIAGDWNLGPTFAQDGFLRIMSFLGGFGIKSLYHEYHGLPLTESMHPTFRHSGGSLHHLDHFWGSKMLSSAMKSLHVDLFEKVIKSDHAPVLLEIG